MNKIFIIAEAGCNHNGDLDIARKLIREAKACGADAVKFQMFRAEDLVRRNMGKAAHLKNIKKEDSVFDMMKGLEFTKNEYLQLKEISRHEGIIIFASVFDIESLRRAREVGFPIIKIPSGEIVNLELLDAASKCGRPIILSTGMSTMSEVERAVDLIFKNLKLNGYENKGLIEKYPIFNKGLMLMHTVSAYPSKSEELNLKAISTLKTVFGLPVGYSDHSLGDEACLAATTLGAQLIERHFTLDKEMDGPDHKASIEPKELKVLVDKVRDIIKMMGDARKRPSQSEKDMILLFRRAIVAKRNIKKGEAIKRGLIEFKRPQDGISCEKINEVLGLEVKRDIRAGDSIKWSDFIADGK